MENKTTLSNKLEINTKNKSSLKSQPFQIQEYEQK